MVTWGRLAGTSGGEWLGVPPTGGSFRVPFTNIRPSRTGACRARASFDLATLCDQADILLDAIHATAAQRTATTASTR